MEKKEAEVGKINKAPTLLEFAEDVQEAEVYRSHGSLFPFPCEHQVG